ncbi:hypothetical protein [Actinocrispum wychmicini]|uniref:Uncharacterized protein n=1 Tax=Actinocrispum wychmicini TaxID=1213861 RepID=A0A4R2JFH0_9PSEU|nr:hypothetical protein [Actinocrispum wychmicini]TCO58491.1 hypothetical protein EV192_105561 [Actinocrispum wychmicini]
MSYPQQGGYPQQPYSGGGHPAETGGGTNPATAIIAALLALAVAAFEIVFLVKTLDGVKLSSLDGKSWAVIGTDAVAGLLLLLGAMLAFGRKVAGAALIIIGAILAVAGFFLFPLLAGGGGSAVSLYLEVAFKFVETATTFQALTLIVAPLAFIFAVIPPTMRHLRGGGGADSYAAEQYPNSGGFQQQGYNAPNSGGFPQQDYPGYQPQQGQGGYPQQGQQGQQGGYPPQQQGW